MATHTIRITTDGTSRSAWPALLAKHGYRVTSGARMLIARTPSFPVSQDRTADITLVPAGMVPGGSLSPREVDRFAVFLRLKKPSPEDALYIRLALSNARMEELSMKRIIVMHEPLSTKGDPRERRLEVTAANGGWVGAPVVSDLLAGDVSSLAYAYVSHDESE
jgi:hypothetical protein